MLFNDEITTLQKGDMVVFDETTKIISFFREKCKLFFSNGSAETILPLDNDLTFLRFIQILADSHGFEVPETTDTDLFFPIKIGNRTHLSYIF